MGGNDEDDRRKHSDFIGNITDVEIEDEDEEALSLCDLPINEENHHLSRKEAPPKAILDSQEEFNFCSYLADSTSKESEMCVADEVFFQGQILPLRHSISSESGLALVTKLQSDNCPTSRCISRSESMDHCYSVGFTSVSSRSSSINSHHSSSSGTSSATLGTTGTSKHKPRPKIRNNFQYSNHPSPKPQIRSSNIKNGITNNSNRKSTIWSIFRVGLVTTPEIAIQDLKFRTNSKSTFGSRNSTSSTLGNSGSGSGRIKAEKEQKKKQKFFDKNGVFFSSCKCSSNAVVGPSPSRVAENAIRRSASANDAHAKNEDQEEKEKQGRTTKQHQQQTGKQALSLHRTFEWLKQLSLEAAAVIDEA